ncbi:MAG: polysaccharide lyase [Verrucomicrobiota bacterium]
MSLRNRLMRVALFGVLPLVSILCGEDTGMRELLRADFDGNHFNRFEERAMKERNVTLVEGSGTDGSAAILVAYVGSELGSERVTFKYPLSKAVSQATLSFDVRFEEDFQWRRGGKLHGLGPLKPVTGGQERRPDGWSARMMFEDDGKVSTYLYEQKHRWRWGARKQTVNPVFDAGKWHHVVLQVSLNDPDQSNGMVSIRIDEHEVARVSKVRFRGKGGSETLIQQLLFSTFHGGHSEKWAPVDDSGQLTTVYAWFDNFSVVEGI